MTLFYTIQIHNRQTGTEHTLQVPDDRYILQSVEKQGVELPFSCRNGACTTCAVRILRGQVYQPEAMGLSPKLRDQGYALLCVSYPLSDLEVETQDEDEVYELQFGRYFAKGKVQFGLPLDEE
jgi:ferredoxin